jgi:hypothetical protein
MKNKRQNERLEEISSALFGSPEDLSLADALEILKLAEISPEELCERTYYKVLLRARAYRARQEEVPPRLRKALEDLRPVTAAPRSQDELDRAAFATISKIVDAVKVISNCHPTCLTLRSVCHTAIGRLKSQQKTKR